MLAVILLHQFLNNQYPANHMHRNNIPSPQNPLLPLAHLRTTTTITTTNDDHLQREHMLVGRLGGGAHSGVQGVNVERRVEQRMERDT